MFDRIQHTLDGVNATLRQPNIPADIALAARKIWQFDTRHDSQKATIADNLLGLATEGLNLVLAGKIADPIFQVFKADTTSTSIQIWFPHTMYGHADDLPTDHTMYALKRRIENGEYQVQGGKKMPMISLALSLMKIAVTERERVEAESKRQLEAA